MPYFIGSEVTPLLRRASRVLGLSQRELGDLCGVSLRTAHRWAAGRAHPTANQVQTLARAVYPHDEDLATELAQVAGTTLVAWGIAAPPAPPAPAAAPRAFPPVAILIDAILLAAVDAADAEAGAPLPRPAIRAALGAALGRARALGLTLDEVDEALSSTTPPASPARPKAPSPRYRVPEPPAGEAPEESAAPARRRR